MMKKSIVLIILIIMSIFILGACDRTFSKPDKLEPTQIKAVNAFDSIIMTIKTGTVSSTGLAVILDNKSDREFIYVPLISLEVQVDDMWYQVPVLNYVTYDMGLSSLMPGDKEELEFNWDYEYGKLGKGKYRVILGEQSHTVHEGSEQLFLAAEFVIE